MSIVRKRLICNPVIIAVIGAFFGISVFAQEADEEPVIEDLEIGEGADSTDNGELEEIVVFGRKPGDRRRVDREYVDPVRAQLLKDFYRMKQEEEEFGWRSSAASDSSSRIKWGYDPRDDYRMRNEMSLQDLPSERTKPATIFRVEF